jgi:Holliday junction resolvase RusA-like endonuclease
MIDISQIDLALCVQIPGPPIPKQRARGGTHGFYTPQQTRAYERHVRACAVAQTFVHRWPEARPGDRYAVEMRIAFADERRRDLTNVAKAVEDACNGVLWHDDSEIWRMLLIKEINRTYPHVQMHVGRVRT